MAISLPASWLNLLEAKDFIESAIDNNDQKVELFCCSSKKSIYPQELYFNMHNNHSSYNLKQVPVDFFRHVPQLLSFDVQQRTTNLDAQMSMDAIDRQSYQICTKVVLHKKHFSTEQDIFKYLHRQFARHLLPLHWLPEFCASYLGYSSADEMRSTMASSDIIADLFSGSLQTIQQAIAGKRLFLCLIIADQDDHHHNHQNDLQSAQRVDVFVGLLDSGNQRLFLVKSVVIPKKADVFATETNDQTYEKLVLAVLLESLNVLWPDSSWRTERKPIDLLLTDFDLMSTGQALLAKFRLLSPVTFASTVHLPQLEYLLRCVGEEINDWFKKDACRTYHFIGSFIACIGHNSSTPFGRFFLRRCNSFVMSANSRWSYQELVLHLREHFMAIQQTLCQFRTDRPSQDFWNAKAEISDIHFFDEFNTVAIMAQLSLLIFKYTSATERKNVNTFSVSSQEALLSEIIVLLQTLTANSALVRPWASSSAAFSKLQTAIQSYQAVLKTSNSSASYGHLKRTLLGGTISQENFFPLTSSLMRQFTVARHAEDVFSVIYALQEAAHHGKLVSKRAHMHENVRFRDFYYGDSETRLENVEPPPTLMMSHQPQQQQQQQRKPYQPLAAIEYHKR